MKFSDKLHSGKFIVTAEVSPPKGTDPGKMLNDAHHVKDIVDAINVTDNQRAVMRMTPAVACSLLVRDGIETIMHLTCRDRNRLALQSELLGASAMGINNVLAMSGDYPTMGDHEGAKPVYDMDSVQLLGLVRDLNRGFDFSGNELEGNTDFCMGAVTNIELNELALIKLQKKIDMGASFIQTQAVFDVEKFSEFMDTVNDVTAKQIKILAGVIPLRSEKSAHFLNNDIAGIKIPQEIIDRMRKVKEPESEGIEIAAEIIKEIRGLCDGVHVMPIGNHYNTKKILELAGII